MIHRLVFGVVCLYGIPMQVAASQNPLPQRCNWPGWQGPTRTNISPETGLLKTWPKEGPKLLWTCDEAGFGWGGLAVWGDRLFVLGTEGEKDCAMAFDVKTGKKLWSTEIGEIWRDGFGVGPRSTPTVDGALVFVIGGQQANLVCLQADSGKVVWRRNYRKDFKSALNIDYGRCVESPLVDGDKVLCTPGGEEGTMFALDKRTGKILWRSERIEEYPTISSMVVAEICGVRQYVQSTDHNLFGVAEDGKLLWRIPRLSNQHSGIAIHSPMVWKDHVLVSYGGNFGGGGDTKLFKLTRKVAKFSYEEVYSKIALHWRQHVLVDGHVYGEIDGGCCLDFLTGKNFPVNIHRTCGIIHADGRLYAYGYRSMKLLEASPAGVKVRGQFHLGRRQKSEDFRQDGFTAPALAGGRLFLRDQEMLYCYDVRDPAAGDAILQGGNEVEKIRIREKTALLPARRPQADLQDDPLPQGALARIGTLRFRPGEAFPAARVNFESLRAMFNLPQGDVAFLPGGKEVASVRLTDWVYVSDLVSGKELRRWEGPEAAGSLSLSPDGKLLVACGTKEIWAWDLSAQPPRLAWKYKYPNPQILFNPVAFSFDGKTLALAGISSPLCLLDARTGIERENLDLSVKSANVRIAFSSDGKWLAVCDGGSSEWDGPIHLHVYDLDKKTKREIPNVGNCYFGFTPDSKALRVVGHVPHAPSPQRTHRDGINLPQRFSAFLGSWNVASGQETRHNLQGVPRGAFFLFSDKGTAVLEVGCGRIRALDPGTGKELRPPLEIVEDYCHPLRRLSPDGELLGYVTNGAVRMREVGSGKLRGPEAPLGAVQVAFSPDGKNLATADVQAIHVWNAATGKWLRQMKVGEVGSPPVQLASSTYHAPTWQTFGWGRRDRLVAANKIGYPVADRLYAFTSKDRRNLFSAWNAQSGDSIQAPVAPFCAGFPPYAFSSTGKLLAVADDFEFSIYDLEKGKDVRTITGVEPIELLAFSPNDKFLLNYSIIRAKTEVGVSAVSMLNVWEIATGKKIAQFPGFLLNISENDVYTPLALSPNAGKIAAVGDAIVRVSDVASGKVEWELKSPEKGVTCLAFSPDGRWLAGGCGDGTVRLWDVVTGKEVHCLTGHRGRVCSLAFSPDGSRLASGSTDSTALIWDLRMSFLPKRFTNRFFL